MKTKINRLSIFLILLVLGSTLGFQSVSNSNYISENKIPIDQFPFFDPKLENLSKNPNNLEEIVSIIITSKPNNFETMIEIIQTHNIKIVSSFQEFSSVEVKAKLEEIINLKFKP